MTVARPVHRRPGSTLYGYLVVEMIFPTLYTLGGLTLVVLTEDLVSLTELVINRGVSAADVAWLGLYQAVPNVSLMLPFAVLVGGLVALGRLGADRELLMLEASGISAPRIVAPVMAFAAVMAGLALALSLHAAPWANRTLDETLAEIERKNPGAGIVAGTVHRFGSWMLQAREVSPRGDRMRGVLLWTPSLGETVFAETLRNGFDLPLIARFVMGKYWRRASPEQRDDYVDLFSRFVIKTYSQHLGGFSGSAFEIVGAKPIGKKDILVRTIVKRKSGPPVKAGWRVREKNDQHKIVDVMIEGISMAVTQRQDFASILKRDGVEGLLQILRAKTGRMPATS